MAALKRLRERRLIDHGPPSHVGEVRPLLDRGYRLSVEQALRLGGAWKRNGDVVSLAESGAQLRRRVQFVGVVPGFVVLAHRALDPEDAHTEGASPPCYGATDTPHPDHAQRLVLERAHRPLTPDLPCLVGAEVVEFLGVLEHRHEHELGERPRVDAAGRRHHDICLPKASLLCDLSSTRHASLHPPEFGGDLNEILDVTSGEVVEDLGLPKHRQKRLFVLGHSRPLFRSRMVPGPPRRRDQILPVEYPQPLIHLPYATDVLFLKVTGYDDRGQSASYLRCQVTGIRLQVFSTSGCLRLACYSFPCGGTVRHPGRVRTTDRGDRYEERGAPAWPVAPLFSLLDLRFRPRRVLPAPPATRSHERHLARLPRRHRRGASCGRGGDVGGSAGGRGGARLAGGAREARLSRNPQGGAGDTRRLRQGVSRRLPHVRRHISRGPASPEGGGRGCVSA